MPSWSLTSPAPTFGVYSMYYLQLTVHEQHGNYDCHSYLWRQEIEEPRYLMDSWELYLPPAPALPSEHAEIMSVIAAVCAEMCKDTPVRHADGDAALW